MARVIQIMGILNVTPDSFYDGGWYYSPERAIAHAKELIQDGADMLDIGGESTRPGSKPVSVEEEIERVCPVISAIRAESSIPISIDTYKAQVAEAALNSGAIIVNDVSGLTFDYELAGVVAKHQAGIILMHMQGRPETMQINPHYENLIEEIYSFFETAVARALGAGIKREKIVIDPGIGFGKSLEDNYRIIQTIQYFKRLGYPICIGLSRKSLIGKLFPYETDRLPGTIALNTVSILNGADILRVHDVKEHRLAVASLAMLEKVS